MMMYTEKTMKPAFFKIIVLLSSMLFVACGPSEPPAPAGSTWYQDADGDKFGNLNETTVALDQPAGYVSDNSDCDDSAETGKAVNPGASEVANFIDDNCNGVIDEGFNYIFVTSTTHQGDLGGLSGADAICQGLADAPTAKVPKGKYKAWLSTEEIDAQDRFAYSTNPIVLANFTEVAPNILELTKGDISNSIAVDESGATHASMAWTGTLADGTLSNSHCQGWTTSQSAVCDCNGGYGSTSNQDARWSYMGSGMCDGAKRLYCLKY